MYEPRHNILSNVRADIRQYIVTWLERGPDQNWLVYKKITTFTLNSKSLRSLALSTQEVDPFSATWMLPELFLRSALWWRSGNREKNDGEFQQSDVGISTRTIYRSNRSQKIETKKINVAKKFYNHSNSLLQIIFQFIDFGEEKIENIFNEWKKNG